MLEANGTPKIGPWNLGRFSRPINAIACAWVALMIPVLSFPTVKGADVTPQTMNWTCLLYGGTMLLSLTWYAVYARKWFVGPKANVDDHVGYLEDGLDAKDVEAQVPKLDEKNQAI